MGIIAYVFFLCYVINHGPGLNFFDIMLITTLVCASVVVLLILFPPKK